VILDTNLKKSPDPSGNELSEYVVKKFCTLSVARTAMEMENVQRLHFVEPGGGGC
jgi:hypothetical protein